MHNPLTDEVLEFIRQDIQQLRAEGCQIVIVSLHWGTEEKIEKTNKVIFFLSKNNND